MRRLYAIRTDKRSWIGGKNEVIGIIDYGAGNLKSVQKAFEFLGEETVTCSNWKEVEQVDKVVLPGVGSFGDAMKELKKRELDRVIREIVNKEIPFLGICLGLQLLFDGSEESGGIEGLRILDGSIVKIPSDGGRKVPHVGWNNLKLQEDGKLFKGIGKTPLSLLDRKIEKLPSLSFDEKLVSEPYVYFVHSYYLKAKDLKIVKATCDYGVTIHASIEKDSVYGCQFHPEKSSEVGLKILSNFAQLL